MPWKHTSVLWIVCKCLRFADLEIWLTLKHDHYIHCFINIGIVVRWSFEHYGKLQTHTHKKRTNDLSHANEKKKKKKKRKLHYIYMYFPKGNSYCPLKSSAKDLNLKSNLKDYHQKLTQHANNHWQMRLNMVRHNNWYHISQYYI